MPFDKLEDFFKVMSPKGTSFDSSGEKPTERKNVTAILKESVLNPRGVYYSYESITKNIEKYYSGKSSEKKEDMKFFHAIGDKPLDMSDQSYWDNAESIGKIVPALRDTKVSLFAMRYPHISPATRGTDHIDFFLNYTPPLVASRMVPYLDVEFEIRTAGKFLDTPSTMRFLLGSRSLDGLSGADKIIADSSLLRQKAPGSTGVTSVKSLVGMELFLMPQSLTNMDSLGPQSPTGEIARLTRVKPFVPFASIEGMDITLQNAGSGDFVSKRANMRLKIHDKSRIGEMSEFLRGPVGFSESLIWTTYGWSISVSDNSDDEYENFINKKMLTRDCWSVGNTQFSFDQTGQVSVSLELLSRAQNTAQNITVCEIDEHVKNFHKAVQTIAELKKKISSDPKFSLPVTAEQVLNAASTSGTFKDIKDMEKAVSDLMTSLKSSGSLTEDEIKNFSQSLSSIRGENSHENITNTTQNAVKEKFDALARSKEVPDPFLPVSEKKESYYPGERPGELITEIGSFIARNEERNLALENSVKKGNLAQQHANGTKKPAAPAVKKKKEENPNAGSNATGRIKLRSDVVSFGKLFATFVAPSIMATKSVDELQIFFYGVNELCGPMGGLSLAEFPIDVNELASAYNDAIKNASVDTLSVQSFLKLVIETQFANHASIAYGKNRFYKSENGKTVLDEADTNTKNGVEQWVAKYGSFKPPTIEMSIEVGEEGVSSKNAVENLKKSTYRRPPDNVNPPDKNIIMRIHIYDKSNNPFPIMQKVINTGNGFEIGEIDSYKLRDVITELYKNGGKEAVEKFQKESDASTYEKFDIVKKSGLESAKIPKDRKSFREAISKTVPSINLGSNGSLVLSINAASKTDGSAAASNLFESIKQRGSKATLGDNGLTETNALPLRILPVQLTMTTVGVPTAQAYQTYFIDFDTGTSLDNIYQCTQIQHTIAQGKFATNWTFILTDGYAKFGSKSINEIISSQAETIVKDLEQAEATRAAEKKSSTSKGKKAAGDSKKKKNTGTA